MWIERDKSGEFNHQKWEIQASNICISPRKHVANLGCFLEASWGFPRDLKRSVGQKWGTFAYV